MIPTIPFIEQKFGEFNELIFGGKLPMLPVVLSSAKTFLGACAYKKKKTLFGGTKYYDFKLRINKRIDLPEQEIEDIIIHEMIHYHIAYNGIKDTSTHGRVFKTLMNDINKRFGRHISVSRKMNAEEKEQLCGKMRRPHVMVVIDFKDGKTGVKQLPRVQQKIIAFCSAISRVTDISSFKLYITDEPYFNRFPTSTALRIQYAEREVLEKHLATARELLIVGGKVVFRK